MYGVKSIKIKILFVLSIILVALVFLIFFIFSPVKIGIILSTDTELGYVENLALLYWKSKNPKIGLRKVVFIKECPPLNERKFEESYLKLVRKGVSVIIGGAISSEGVILAKLAKKYNVPTFGITTATTLLNDSDDNFYRLMPPNNIEAKYTAFYLNELGVNKLLIILVRYNSEFTQTYVDVLKKRVKTCYTVFFDSDIEKIKRKLVEYKPDAVFLLVPSHLIAILSKTIKEVDENFRIFSSPWGRISTFIDLWDDSINGLQFITPDKPDFSKYDKLVEDFEKTYKIKAGIGVGYALSTIDLIYTAIEKAGKSRKKLIEYFRKPRLYEFAYGKTFMNEYGDSISEAMYILELKDRRVYQIGKLPVDEFHERKGL